MEGCNFVIIGNWLDFQKKCWNTNGEHSANGVKVSSC